MFCPYQTYDVLEFTLNLVVFVHSAHPVICAVTGFQDVLVGRCVLLDFHCHSQPQVLTISALQSVNEGFQPLHALRSIPVGRTDRISRPLAL